jgi:hypothetical protein
VTDPDPFVVLGLTRAATLDEVRAARRRLAFEVHPDHGGDDATMQSVNAAFEACVAHLTGRRPLADGAPSTAAAPSPDAGDARGARGARGRWRRPAPSAPPQRGRRRFVEHDAPSFTIDALPAEAFEALLVVVSWIGDVLDDDPPYVLECHLREPSPCWCRLELVPDAGGSTVSIVVASSTDGDPPLEPGFVEQVRDVWVEHLNQLGGPLP